MSAAARERLALLLAQTIGYGAFSASRTAPPDDLLIEVRGVGALELPISGAQARALHQIGRPARYGVGELTLLDPAVRDTCEIPKSRVRIDKRRFDRTLLPVLDRIGRDLGVPAGGTLAAELHSMLVYGRGQFFAPHQDSEKDDAMVGTLVVGLPSTFKGGTLVVSHGGESASYRGSKTKLSFVAFYADCRHEAHRVTSGHRVVLPTTCCCVASRWQRPSWIRRSSPISPIASPTTSGRLVNRTGSCTCSTTSTPSAASAGRG